LSAAFSQSWNQKERKSFIVLSLKAIRENQFNKTSFKVPIYNGLYFLSCSDPLFTFFVSDPFYLLFFSQPCGQSQNESQFPSIHTHTHRSYKLEAKPE